MPQCSDCLHQKEAPGRCIEIGCVEARQTFQKDNSPPFPFINKSKFQLKKVPETPFVDRVIEEDLPGPEKECDNCGRKKQRKYEGVGGGCLYDSASCSWTPLCETCKGAREVINPEITEKMPFVPVSPTTIPCPTCSPTSDKVKFENALASNPKPRQIMIPARWEDYQLITPSGHILAITQKGSPVKREKPFFVYDCKIYHSFDEAQSAVEKALEANR